VLRGNFVIVAGRVAVLAVEVNNTVAYKKESRGVRCYFLGLSQIRRGLGPRDFSAVPLPRAVAR